MRLSFTVTILAGIGLLPLLAQEGAKPAPVIHIIREVTKEGRAAAHERVETEWAAASRKLKDPSYSLALETMSGADELWWISPQGSFAAAEESQKFGDNEPAKSTYAMLDARDGELRASSRGMWAVYRPDLSYHADKFNPAKARFVTMGTYRVHLGRDEDFAAGAKQYFAAWEKANIDQCTLGYEVASGAPAGTFLFFTGMDSMKVMDGAPERMRAIQQAMGADAFSQFMKGTGDLFVSIEETLFQVKPAMSYVPQTMIDADPAFWKPKPAPKPASANPPPAPAEKKSGQ